VYRMPASNRLQLRLHLGQTAQPDQRNMFVFANSTISLPRPFKIAFSM
jgi:hypothetical protein